MSLCEARNRTTSPFSFFIGTMSSRQSNGLPAQVEGDRLPKASETEVISSVINFRVADSSMGMRNARYRELCSDNELRDICVSTTANCTGNVHARAKRTRATDYVKFSLKPDIFRRVCETCCKKVEKEKIHRSPHTTRVFYFIKIQCDYTMDGKMTFY